MSATYACGLWHEFLLETWALTAEDDYYNLQYITRLFRSVLTTNIDELIYRKINDLVSNIKQQLFSLFRTHFIHPENIDIHFFVQWVTLTMNFPDFFTTTIVKRLYSIIQFVLGPFGLGARVRHIRCNQWLAVLPSLTCFFIIGKSSNRTNTRTSKISDKKRWLIACD